MDLSIHPNGWSREPHEAHLRSYYARRKESASSNPFCSAPRSKHTSLKEESAERFPLQSFPGPPGSMLAIHREVVQLIVILKAVGARLRSIVHWYLHTGIRKPTKEEENDWDSMSF